MAIFVALLQEDEEILFELSHANSNFKKVKRYLVTAITIYKPEMIFQRRLQLTRANGSDRTAKRIRSSPNPTKRNNTVFTSELILIRFRVVKKRIFLGP
jgi:hypothetical protein